MIILEVTNKLLIVSLTKRNLLDTNTFSIPTSQKCR